jgi:glycosyltransferase involved in cell wall biosynthesis
MRVGLLYYDLNSSGGRQQVVISIIRALRKLGLGTVLLCGKKTDKSFIRNNFGVNLEVHKELVLPIWPSRVQTYFGLLLPVIAKPFCDVLINPYSNDILPQVDVTYFHYAQQLILRQKMRESKTWNHYYRPYQAVQRALAVRASHRLLLANSFFTANVIREQIGITPVVIYPPVFLRKTTNSAHTRKNIVLTIARFSLEKKLEQIPLVARDVDANFVILGSVRDATSTSYSRVCRLIKEYGVKDRVTMIINAPNNFDVKMELLQKAKVYFHTMPFEPFGISIVEGMGAGCIPVVHDSGGAREFVPKRWRYKDTEDAKQKIKEALDSWSNSIAKDMETIAYQFREERFIDDFSETLNAYLRERNKTKVVSENVSY